MACKLRRLALMGSGEMASNYVAAFKLLNSEVSCFVLGESGRIPSGLSKNAHIHTSTKDLSKCKQWDKAIFSASTSTNFRALEYLRGAERHVLVEKPLFPSYAAGENFSLEGLENVRVGLNRRFYASTEYAANFIMESNASFFFRFILDSWGKPESPALLHQGIHVIDLIAFLFGKLSFQSNSSMSHKDGSESHFVNVTAGNHVGVIEIGIGTANTYSLEITKGRSSATLSPLEIFTEFDGLELVQDKSGTNRHYLKKKIDETSSYTSSLVKAGLLEQTKIFLETPHDFRLGRVSDALNASSIARNLQETLEDGMRFGK